MIAEAKVQSGAFLLLVSLLAGACTSGGARPHRSLASTTSAVGVARSTESSTRGPVPGAFVRTCQTSVYGDLGKGWRRDKNAVVVGPLVLLYPGSYSHAPRSSFTRHATGYPSPKVLAVVAQGATVTVAIAPAATRVASLLYDSQRFDQPGGYAVSDGERAVTFRACAMGSAHAATQFNGGFIVAGPHCVPVQIWIGNTPTPVRRVLSFGTGDCVRHVSSTLGPPA